MTTEPNMTLERIQDLAALWGGDPARWPDRAAAAAATALAAKDAEARDVLRRMSVVDEGLADLRRERPPEAPGALVDRILADAVAVAARNPGGLDADALLRGRAEALFRGDRGRAGAGSAAGRGARSAPRPAIGARSVATGRALLRPAAAAAGFVACAAFGVWLGYSTPAEMTASAEEILPAEIVIAFAGGGSGGDLGVDASMNLDFPMAAVGAFAEFGDEGDL